MVVHTDDAGPSPNDLRLVKVPAMHHEKKSVRPVYPTLDGGYPRLVTEHRGPEYEPRDGQKLTTPLGFIPQVEYTHGYWDNEYGLMNDVGLAMGETTCSAKTAGWPLGQPFGHNLFSINELSRVALERCTTARCAVKTMGRLAEEYGFYGDDSGDPNHPDFVGSSEALGVVDAKGEGWVFHVLTGPHNRSAIWAAQRVDDREVAAVPNGFVIRKMNLSDSDNFLASKNVHSFAKESGWWDPKDGPFDFTAAYSPFYPGPSRALYVGRRLWRIFDLLAPSLKLDMHLGWMRSPTYPFAVRPDKPLTLNFMREILRDHYEGTPIDMTKGIAAGPFGNPVRYDGNVGGGGGWEREISMYRASYSYIAQTRRHPRLLSGVVWYGLDAPHGTVYVPFYGSAGQPGVPKSYLVGLQSEFSLKSAWWAFNFVNNWIQLKYNAMIKDVQEEQKQLECEGERRVEQWDKKARELLKDGEHAGKVLRYLEGKTSGFAEDVVDRHWRLAAKLVAKYSNGNVVVGERSKDMTVPGYPVEWLQQTDFASYGAKTWTPGPTERPVVLTRGLSQDFAVMGSLVVAAAVFVGVARPWRRVPGYQALA